MSLLSLSFFLFCFFLIHFTDPKLFVKCMKISHLVLSGQTKRSEPLPFIFSLCIVSKFMSFVSIFFFFLLKNFEKPSDKIYI